MTESQEKELFAMFRKQHEQAIAGEYVFMPTITPLHFVYLLDRIEALEQDTARYRWLCDGHGYFLEEEGLCGHFNEKASADAAIDAAMNGGKE